MPSQYMFNYLRKAIQGEVDKRHQDYPGLDKIPDLIFHVPNTQDKLTVVEFKIVRRQYEITGDFRRLITFSRELGYKHLIQVLVGDSADLAQAREHLRNFEDRRGTHRIMVVSLDTGSWEVQKSTITKSLHRLDRIEGHPTYTL